ncbi:MAG: tetratricopeptide repeat protein [Planctomycetes bacterium]|nr:tetratricopeptide repeat protein [Planctomycetota bacterium]HPF15813.1 tetratricopeptide repeat protein [Planctomycetota bacterium]HRV83144.1 tetratricopeptide repeat protein [Planctomycetota bacterium]
MAAKSAEVTSDPAVRVEALALVARCYFLEDNPNDGQIWLERAEALASPSEPMGYSRCRQVRGLFERARGNGDKALEVFESLYNYCRDNGLYERALDAAHHLAMLAPLDGQVVWARRAIAAAEKGGNEALLAILWNNLGLTYEHMGRPLEALASYRRARWFHYRTGDERDRLIADWAVGRALRLSHRSPEALLWLQDVVQRAEVRWQANPRQDEAKWRGYAYQEFGEVQADLGLTQEAIASLESARLAFLGVGTESLEAGVFESLMFRLDDLQDGFH